MAFQDRYNKPDSAIPPVSETLFNMVLIQIQQSLVNQINRVCGPCQDKKVRMK
jgi:hypothetical protein